MQASERNGIFRSRLSRALALCVLVTWATAATVAAGNSVTVTQITLETRFWIWGCPGSTAAAVSGFNSAPTNVVGYTNTPVSLSDLACCYINNANLAGSGTNIAYHHRIAVTSTGTSTVSLRLGMDFGLGGTLMVDGAEVQARWSDMWWGYHFWNPTQYLEGTVVLTPGPHLVELYGFEGCCDGAIGGDLDIGDGWQVIALGNFGVPDTTPPTLACAASPGELWPPNHKLAPVEVQVTITDDESGPAGFALVSVTSSEPDDGLGDGDSVSDLQGWDINTADTEGLLRAERSGAGTGRVYTLTYRGADMAGNSAICSCEVKVPHDWR